MGLCVPNTQSPQKPLGNHFLYFKFWIWGKGAKLIGISLHGQCRLSPLSYEKATACEVKGTDEGREPMGAPHGESQTDAVPMHWTSSDALAFAISPCRSEDIHEEGHPFHSLCRSKHFLPSWIGLLKGNCVAPQPRLWSSHGFSSRRHDLASSFCICSSELKGVT